MADIWLKYGLKYYPIDQSIIRQKLLETKTKNEQDIKERARKALKTQIPNAPQVQIKEKLNILKEVASGTRIC